MNFDFWNARWSQQQIGFHEGRPNGHLEKFWPSLQVDSAATVFVPLCGKAEDLAWLRARGHRVVGVELIRSAVEAFYAEHGLTPTVTREGAFEKFEAEGITVFVGDFFAVTSAHLAGATVLYDRAAMIALPPPMRERYVKHLRAVLPAQARGLLVTVSYDQSKMDGPPFSVPADEVRAHYAGLEVTQLDEVRAGGPRFEPLNGRETVFALRF